MSHSAGDQDALYREAAAAYSSAIARLARGYEPDPEKRRDLVQDIHVALWRSLAQFAGRASMRTWVYRVAHNTAISRISRRRASIPLLVTLDELAETPVEDDGIRAADRRMALERLLALIRTLDPLDRQVILLYLEELDAQSIAAIVGLSPGNVATKVHRIKQVLSRRFQGTLHDAYR
jgi:RNA polymerase sigma-70 factor (ECF subfamily)